MPPLHIQSISFPPSPVPSTPSPHRKTRCLSLVSRRALPSAQGIAKDFESKIYVKTLAFGADADGAKLRNLAAIVGGEFSEAVFPHPYFVLYVWVCQGIAHFLTCPSLYFLLPPPACTGMHQAHVLKVGRLCPLVAGSV